MMEVVKWAMADIAVSDFSAGFVTTVEEAERARRFRVEAARRHFLHGRGLARAVAGQVAGRAVAIGALESGAPMVVGLPEVGVSLSRCGGMALAAAWTGAGRIGVDIEVMRVQAPDVLGMVAGEGDLGAVMSLPEGLRAGAVLRIWCAKEAALKAQGTGFAGTDPRGWSLPSGMAAGIDGAASEGVAQGLWLSVCEAGGHVMAFALPAQASLQRLPVSALQRPI